MTVEVLLLLSFINIHIVNTKLNVNVEFYIGVLSALLNLHGQL